MKTYKPNEVYLFEVNIKEKGRAFLFCSVRLSLLTGDCLICPFTKTNAKFHSQDYKKIKECLATNRGVVIKKPLYTLRFTTFTMKDYTEKTEVTYDEVMQEEKRQNKLASLNYNDILQLKDDTEKDNTSLNVT